MEANVISLFFLNTLSPCLFYLLTIISHATGLSNVLSKIRSPSLVYNTEEEDYFAGGVMGVTTVVHHNMEISDSKPTSKPSANKVRNVRIEEVDSCTTFVGGMPGNKICGLTKGDNGYCNKYKTHVDLEKRDVKSAF